MLRLNVEPRTEAWHALRADSWTASAAATLVAKDNAIALRDYAASKGVVLDIAPLLAVGIESYFENTLWKAWAEKTGRIPRFKGNAHTERGQVNEAKVLLHFEQSELMLVERDITAVASTDPWLLASFDALATASSDPSVSAPFGFPIEAKCPAFVSRKKLWEAKKAGKLSIMGLPYYWCQVQHQMAVAQAPYAWFVAAGVEPNKDTGVEEIVFPIIEKVPRDDAFLAAYLAAAKFYHQEFIEPFVEPPKLACDMVLLEQLAAEAALAKTLADNDVDAALDLYFEACREEEIAAKRRKELEEKVRQAAAAMRKEGDDVVVLGDRLEVSYGTASAVSWQKVAKRVAKDAGLGDIPEEVLAACTSVRESVKLKEIA